jgi:hypothetical protein
LSHPTTASLILQFLRVVGMARIERIVRYMRTDPLSTSPGATRNQVWRLARDGRITRMGYGVYQARGEP